jgi:Protein of unknown function (DUF2442)
MVDREDFREATERGTRRRRESPFAIRARLDRKRQRIIVTLNSRDEFAFFPAQVEGLEHSSSADLARIEITPSGFGLHFPDLDVYLYVPALMRGVYGSSEWIAKRARQAAAGEN